LGAFVEKNRHEVSFACDAAQALSLLQEKPFDVVVTDIILPRKTGVALLAEIREEQPDGQVIMITREVKACLRAFDDGFQFATTPHALHTNAEGRL